MALQIFFFLGRSKLLRVEKNLDPSSAPQIVP